MAKPPKVFEPVIATGNALRSGDVIFRTAAGLWAHDLHKAYVASTPEAASDLRTAADADGAANIVVDVALIAVSLEAGRIRPLALRERIRAQGPTIALPRDGAIGDGHNHDATAAMAQDI